MIFLLATYVENTLLMIAVLTPVISVAVVIATTRAQSESLKEMFLDVKFSMEKLSEKLEHMKDVAAENNVQVSGTLGEIKAKMGELERDLRHLEDEVNQIKRGDR